MATLGSGVPELTTTVPTVLSRTPQALAGSAKTAEVTSVKTPSIRCSKVIRLLAMPSVRREVYVFLDQSDRHVVTAAHAHATGRALQGVEGVAVDRPVQFDHAEESRNHGRQV